LPPSALGEAHRLRQQGVLQSLPEMVPATGAGAAERFQSGRGAPPLGDGGRQGPNGARAAAVGAATGGSRGRRVKPRIVICATQVPFAYGGAEMLGDSLRDELRARDFEVDVAAIPFTWPTRVELLKGSLAWRLVNLEEAGGKRIDRVIATRFPSYLVKHPNKVVWLIHQLRQAYDLLGTPYSDFAPGAARAPPAHA